MNKKILFVVNELNFFLSHRLSIAKEASKKGYLVHLAIENKKLTKVENEQLKDFQITLENLKVYDDKNFKKYIGDIVILNNKKNTIVRLKPEIRVYNSPETITYEASIKSKLFGDTYVTMSNISRSDFYNIKFQIKPFMNLIWFSTILIVLGGLLRMKDRKF